jgi:hypothetical protein
MPKRSKIPKDKVRPLLSSQREKLEAQRRLKLQFQIDEFEDEVSRTVELQSRIKNLSDPEDIMLEIVDVFKDIEWVPSQGKYYTFIYNAKTVLNRDYEGVRDLDKVYYDQHPLVAVFRIYKWGFEGLNYHWKKVRRYTWEEVAGALHVIESSELDYMRRVNYMKLRKYQVNK